MFEFGPGMFVHIALVFYGLGFMVRDELWLRGLILIGTGFYLLYYFYFPATPLWDAIYASLFLAAINITLIIIIIRERTLLAMNSEEAGLYQAFQTLTPGQFRKLMRHATWQTTAEPHVLTREGELCNKLYYLISGKVTAEKAQQGFELEPEIFIGEIGFLTGTPASATVIAPEGTVYIEWRSEDLKRLMRKSQPLENALAALFNFDLARKVAIGIGR